MKTIQYLYKYVLTLILMMMGAQQLQAQDAFYIYRNDGNFDGFFYDEIVRMNYSKIDLEGEEHDVYVIQEIETNDSLYRIPLAAIDSIGFQQPEIRMNPRFKNMDDLGITPYITQTSGWSSARLGLSKSIPAHLLPEIGDVMATWDPSIDEGRGWVYKITSKSEPASWLNEDDNSYYYNVEDVKDINDIFDQYITVEDIGVDEQGYTVRRRIAGCNPDGIIRRAKEGGGEVNLINLSGTFSREWQPGGDSKIALSADIGVLLKLRVHYNIGWTRLFVKLSRDLVIKADPSLSMSVSKGFEETLSDLCHLPGIMFPATCPIFETNPVPELFVRGEGSISASLNFPAVEIGIGEDIIIDDSKLFPISYDLHMVPKDEDKDASDVIDTGSVSVKFSGYAQAGIKFSANLSTASWFSDILFGDVGLNLYCGPKVEGELEFSSTIDTGLLQSASIRLSLLSLDLEAKATAAALWQDPEEKTFFSKNWSFLCDTIRFFPVFENAEIVDIKDNIVTAKIRTKPYYIPAYSVISVGVFNGNLNSGINTKILKSFGSEVYSQKKQEYIFTFSLDELKDLKCGGYGYRICPVVAWAGREAKGVFYSDGNNCYSTSRFNVPAWMEIDKTHLEFGCNDNLTQKIRVKTNIQDFNWAAIETLKYHNPNPTHQNQKGFWETEIEPVDSENGIYDITFTVEPNTDMFYREMTEKECHIEEVEDMLTMTSREGYVHNCPYILLPKKYSKWPDIYHSNDINYNFTIAADTVFITFHQPGSDAALTDRKVEFSAEDFWKEVSHATGYDRASHSLTFYQFGDNSQKEKESFTMARDGNDRVIVTCKTLENSSSTYKERGNTYTRTYKEEGTMSFVIARSPDSQWGEIFHDINDGTCSSLWTSSDTNPESRPMGGSWTTNFTFSGKHNEEKTLKSATSTCVLNYSQSTTTKSHSLTSTSNGAFSLSY